MATILITGATGTLSMALRSHWEGKHDLRLLSRRKLDPAVIEADLRCKSKEKPCSQSGI